MDWILERTLQQALVSLVGCLIGSAVGGGLGYGCALLLRLVLSALPQLRKPMILFPWRTVIVSLLLPLYLITILVALMVTFGIGSVAATIAVAANVALLTLPFVATTFLNAWEPPSIITRLARYARTLAAVSVGFATGVGLGPDSGLGFVAVQKIRLFEYDEAVKFWLAIVLLILAFDLVFGIIQLLVCQLQEKGTRRLHNSLAG